MRQKQTSPFGRLLKWKRLITDARVFLETWGAQADRLGWTDTAIFGVDPSSPFARIDKAGLVVLLDGGRGRNVGRPGRDADAERRKARLLSAAAR
jgi:aminoglycoside N3'-acetyltransferase